MRHDGLYRHYTFSGYVTNEGPYLPQNEPLQRQEMDATAAQRCDVFSRSVLGCLPHVLRVLHIAVPRSALEGPLHALTTTFDFAEPIAGSQASTALGRARHQHSLWLRQLQVFWRAESQGIFLGFRSRNPWQVVLNSLMVLSGSVVAHRPSIGRRPLWCW